MTESQALAQWMAAEYARFYRLKKVPQAQEIAILASAEKAIALSKKNRTLKILSVAKIPRAILLQMPSNSPRIRNQQSLHLHYEQQFRVASLPWIKKQLLIAGKKSPRHITIQISPDDDRDLRAILEKAAFRTRYEILMGETDIALKNLIRIKNPPENLDHLGLEIKEITKKTELNEVMKLQRLVATQSKKHSYFSHTTLRLKEDRLQYEEHLAKKSGKLIGVYKEERLVGLMIASIMAGGVGGLSFFLHPKIQGKGIVKTGYRLLLEYFKKEKVKKFYGGTSRDSVQGLGKIMKRKVQFVIYVKL